MHHLRSPLLSVANAVAIVQEVEPETRFDDPEVVECLRAMATCSQLMQHIVSDMLDFERIDGGRLNLVPAAMRISQLLEAAADTFGGPAALKGITLRLVPLLPDLERAVFIGDVRRLQQCVNNGVSNSINVRGSCAPVRARLALTARSCQRAPPALLPSPLPHPLPFLLVYRGGRHGNHPCVARGPRSSAGRAQRWIRDRKPTVPARGGSYRHRLGYGRCSACCGGGRRPPRVCRARGD
ncbi:hypothetical protein T492DRAFT_236687 [Pavlovales sp. CCMP2436]|nr:hypothetical protein T492DRAFT_236687 [Pavlovales sp. CCMP2436]